MYSFRYCFYPKTEDIDGYYSRELSSYLAALGHNGQMLGDWNIGDTGDALEVFCVAPDEDSLDEAHFNDFAREAYDQLAAGSRKPPEYTLVGPAIGLDEACACSEPSAYVLYTTLLDIEPPVICADCGGRVPLYRLPFYKDEKEYWAIHIWEEAYKACDTLYLNAGVGERFAKREMSNPKSKLTQMGLSICREMSDKLDRPFYYYLQTSGERLVKVCPACGSDWRIEKPVAGRFDLKCDACGFVSMGPG